MRYLSLLTFFLGSIQIMISQNDRDLQRLDSVFLSTKTQITQKNSGKVVTLISEEILERSRGQSVAELLGRVSGFEINGSKSNEGQNLGYYVRGGRNHQVVIMIDGIQLNDPSQITNEYDLRLIPTTNIESIEIIKGASSVLYGSGAATAVINISTKNASSEAISAKFSSLYGTNRAVETEGSNLDEFTNFVTVNGTLKKFFYDLNFSNRYVEGLSALAAAENEPAFNEDVFDRINGKIKLGYRFNKNFRLSRFFSFDKYKAGFDDFGYIDANNQSVSDQRRSGGRIKWDHSSGSVTINDNFSWIERSISSSFPTKYDSKSYTFDAFANQRITDQISVLLGLNGNFSSFNSFSIPFGNNVFMQDINEEAAKFNIVDPYLNLVYTSNFGFNLNLGGRLSFHSNYGNHAVYSINPSYIFKLGEQQNLKILSSYSTAYITPSLFQLYDLTYGNESLKPEENATIEAGLELFTTNQFRISAVYFNRTESNFIDFVNIDPKLFLYQYENVSDEFMADGVEVEASKRFGNRLELMANYTFTQIDRERSLRIPKHKVNAHIGYSIGKKSDIGLSYQFTSAREDIFHNPLTFEAERIELQSYSLVDLTASHRITQNFKLYAGLSNIFDTEYEELYRFQTRGRNLRFGFDLEF